MCQQRFRQPGADVLLAPTGLRAQGVQRLPGDELGEVGLGVGHRGQVNLSPAQVALLQHVVGFGCAAEYLVGDREQQRPQGRESLGVLVTRRGGHRTGTTFASARSAARSGPFSDVYEPGLRGLATQPLHRVAAHLLLDERACAAADVDVGRGVVLVLELQGAAAAAEADALGGHRYRHVGDRGARDPRQDGVGGLSAQRQARLAAHPVRQSRRRRGVTGCDDPGIIDAGQRLVRDEPACSVGGQSARRGEAGNPEARRPHRHRARQHAAVGKHHMIGTHGRHRRIRALDHRDAELGQPLDD